MDNDRPCFHEKDEKLNISRLPMLQSSKVVTRIILGIQIVVVVETFTFRVVYKTFFFKAF